VEEAKQLILGELGLFADHLYNVISDVTVLNTTINRERHQLKNVQTGKETKVIKNI